MEENTVMANPEVETEQTEKPGKWATFKAKMKKPAIIAGSLLALKIAYDKGKKHGFDDGYEAGEFDAKQAEEPEVENEEEEE